MSQLSTEVDEVLAWCTVVVQTGPVAECVRVREIDDDEGPHLDCMNDRDAITLGRYGARQATVALCRGSAGLLRDALLATAICQVIRNDDPRNVMVGRRLWLLVDTPDGPDFIPAPPP